MFFLRFEFLVWSKFNYMQWDCTRTCPVLCLHPHNTIANVVVSLTIDDENFLCVHKYIIIWEMLQKWNHCGRSKALSTEHHGKCLTFKSFVKLVFFLSRCLCLCLYVCLSVCCVLCVVCCVLLWWSWWRREGGREERERLINPSGCRFLSKFLPRERKPNSFIRLKESGTCCSRSVLKLKMCMIQRLLWWTSLGPSESSTWAFLGKQNWRRSLPCVDSKTPSYVHSKRTRVCGQHAHMVTKVQWLYWRRMSITKEEGDLFWMLTH